MAKEYKCKMCGNYFIKIVSSLQKVCSPECAIKLSREQTRKAREKKTNRRESKTAKMTALKEKNKTKHELTKEAQVAVNKYIRLRDVGKECISCGTPLVAEQLGGGFDAGHYRSRGAAPHLRFYTSISTVNVKMQPLLRRQCTAISPRLA